jgi:hypothetical protein
MPEEITPPTFFGNIITAHVTTDEVSFEVRRLMPTHSQISEVTKGGREPMKPLTESDVYAIPPIAKVVLTFTAAKNLRDNLNTLITQMEEARKRGA